MKKGKPVIAVPKQERSRQTREKIAAAAMDLFAVKGFDATTTTMIAKKAKVAVGSVYAHFNDKYEIFLLGIENYYSRLYEMIISDKPQGPIELDYDKILNSFRVSLRNTYEVYCMKGDLNLEIERFLLMDKRAYALHEKYHAMENKIIKESMMLFGDAMGGYDMDVLVSIYHNFLHSVFTYIYRNRRAIDVDKYLETTVQMIASMLFNHTPAGKE